MAEPEEKPGSGEGPPLVPREGTGGADGTQILQTCLGDEGGKEHEYAQVVFEYCRLRNCNGSL